MLQQSNKSSIYSPEPIEYKSSRAMVPYHAEARPDLAVKYETDDKHAQGSSWWDALAGPQNMDQILTTTKTMLEYLDIGAEMVEMGAALFMMQPSPKEAIEIQARRRKQWTNYGKTPYTKKKAQGGKTLTYTRWAEERTENVAQARYMVRNFIRWFAKFALVAPQYADIANNLQELEATLTAYPGRNIPISMLPKVEKEKASSS